MTLKLGIDDAGRGPVIGPMALAGVLIDEKIEALFKQLDVKDSKKVLPKKRKILEQEIKNHSISFDIQLTYPEELDSRMLSGTNLNKIEAIKAARIIDNIMDPISKEFPNEIVYVVIDCPSPNTESWKSHLMEQITYKENIQVSCEHKADVNHISAAAASILAKEARESELEKIKKRIGRDFGSGYQTDPVTTKFLEEYSHEHINDGIIRTTWQTWKDTVTKKEQKKLF